MAHGSIGTITIIGFMGSGKSMVGAVLAKKLDIGFVDLDERIAAAAGMSIEEIFSREGEGGFRRRESKALIKELEGGKKVLSCGGGVVLDAGNVEILRERSRVFYLNISKETAVEHLAGGEGRPLLEAEDLAGRVSELMNVRKEKYLEAAHETLQVDDMAPEEIAEEIATRWQRYRYEHPGEATIST